MPRMGRIVLPNYPHHVLQRGHNRQVVFNLSSLIPRALLRHILERSPEAQSAADYEALLPGSSSPSPTA